MECTYSCKEDLILTNVPLCGRRICQGLVEDRYTTCSIDSNAAAEDSKYCKTAASEEQARSLLLPMVQRGRVRV